MNSSSPDVHFMHLALEQARTAQSDGEVPVGAVVVKDGQVVAVGRNQSIGSHDPTAHAEIVALRAAAQALGNYRLEGCSLYVTLEPCAMCAGAILEARVQQVIYGATEPRTGAAGSVVNLFEHTGLNHHTSITSGVLATESSNLLTGFFSARRRVLRSSAQPLREDALRTPDDCFAPADALFPECKYLRVGDSGPPWRLHYADAGSQNAATSVLLLHDVPGWGYRWHALLPMLVDAGFRVLAPDLLGFGRSDKPKKKQGHSQQLHFLSLEAMMTLVHSKSRVVVIGQGYGLALASRWISAGGGAISDVVGVAPSTDIALDKCPHPSRSFTAGIDFFTEWVTAPQPELWKQSAPYTLESAQSIVLHLQSVEATG